MTIKQDLEQAKKENKYSNPLKYYVIDYILDNYKTDEEKKTFISDLLNHGCVSGMVGSLIYYSDTEKFYNKYEQEIENLISDSMDMQGIDNRNDFIKGLNGSSESMQQQKNLLSWFAFEETTRAINEEFKIYKDFL